MSLVLGRETAEERGDDGWLMSSLRMQMEGDGFEFCQRRIVDLTDTAFVDAEFSCHIVLASMKIVKEGHHVVLALAKAFPGILDIGPVHKGGSRGPGRQFP
jgi:hypothetical protein